MSMLQAAQQTWTGGCADYMVREMARACLLPCCAPEAAAARAICCLNPSGNQSHAAAHCTCKVDRSAAPAMLASSASVSRCRHIETDSTMGM